MNHYSFSTAWNALKHVRGADIAAEIQQLGFSNLEINFQFIEDKLRDLSNYVRKEGMKITSIHNYCPVPDGVPVRKAMPDCYSLASNNEAERKKAVHFTKRTIETASQLKADVVVLHSGRVETEPYTRQLINLYKEGKKDSTVFHKLKADAVGLRQELVKEYFDAVCTSYSELVPFAKDRNVRLGIENRYYYNEIPSQKEYKILFNYFDNKVIGYWHDMGHAYVLEKLGFYPPESFLGKYHKKMIGIHIHDIINLRDHHAPFMGEFPWPVLKRHVTKHVIKVLEIHPFITREEIVRGVKELNKEVFV